LALGDVAPHIIVQSLHPRVGEFSFATPKRLLQQYPPAAAVRRSGSFVTWRHILRTQMLFLPIFLTVYRYRAEHSSETLKSATATKKLLSKQGHQPSANRKLSH
jgi:hypothetical protein